MTQAYFDCFAGAGGDMIVAALLDAGADFAALSDQLGRLGVEGLAVRRETVMRGGIGGTKFHVDCGHRHNHGHDHEHAPEDHHHAHRGLSDILSILDRAQLAARVSSRAKAIFTRLAQAEAKVHRCTVEDVHFHEVGAIDSIADIIGACICLELLDVEKIFCSAIPLGNGTVQCEHGLLPVPPPATAELVKGAKIAPSDVQAEMTTPTAAAILTTLAEGFGPMEPMDISAVGYGAGTRDGGPMPNLLRVFVGQCDSVGTADTVIELSANIDDCTGEVLGAVLDKLLSAGCVDAWAAPITMKKSRPAWMLSALCVPADVAAVERLMFCETTTFGIRRRTCGRSKLSRRFETAETPYGPIRIKVGTLGEQIVTASPEFADCVAAAEAHHVSVREVLTTATEIYRQGKAR